MTLNGMTLNATVRELNGWIDSYEPNAVRNGEARAWAVVAKIGEEFGEVVSAMMGATNQNPRKGLVGDLGDVRKELLDVALAALCAVHHLDDASGDVLEQLESHAAGVAARASRSMSTVGTNKRVPAC